MASTIDLNTLLTSLPACKRCRRNRRRCDTKLPLCANCSKAGVECIFYDHTLQEELPRSYIASLVEHLTRDDDTVAAVETPVAASIAAVNPLVPTDIAQIGHHFAYAQGAYRYLGAGSHLLDVKADDAKSIVQDRHRYCSTLPPLPRIVAEQLPRDLRVYLTQVFFDTVHQLYPFLDPLRSQFLSSTTSHPDSQASSATQEFIQEMVCAVACHCERSDNASDAASASERKQRLGAIGTAAHARALRRIEEATASQAVSTLQVVVLLVLYTLVCPSIGGNISQQLGFAIRLVIDLYESGSDSEGEDDGERERLPSLTSLYKIIYCLENHVCGVLVRPTALPEPAEPLVMPTFSEFLTGLSQHSDDNRSLDLLCTLYRIQARTRNGSHTNALDTLRSSLPAFADEYKKHLIQNLKQKGRQLSQILHPNVAAVLGETCLLLDPTSSDAALHLLEAYADPGYLATFISPYWVHRAATVITDELTDGKEPTQLPSIQAYGQAVALLTSWATNWDAASVLRYELNKRLAQ